MDHYTLKLLELNTDGNILHLGLRVKGPYDPVVREPKVVVTFDNGEETRRLPILLQTYFPEEDLKTCVVFAKYDFRLDYLFFEKPQNKKIRFWFEFTYGNLILDHLAFSLSSDIAVEEETAYRVTFSEGMDEVCFELLAAIPQTSRLSATMDIVTVLIQELWSLFMLMIAVLLLPVFCVEGLLALIGCVKNVPRNNRRGILFVVNHVRTRMCNLCGKRLAVTSMKLGTYEIANKIAWLKKVKPNRITFISSRRDDLSGNFEFVYRILKEDPSLDLRFVLDSRETKKMSFRNAARCGYYFGTSKVILIDDFSPPLYHLPRRDGTVLIQLWHACGAFKTFGYSRLGKEGGQKQASPNHRNYDYAIVSSSEISKFYAEGFGISLDKVAATGIPRTDIFFDKAYGDRVRGEFYGRYPELKNKKVLLFAPTFRGNGKLSGYYPVEKFNLEKLYEELGGEYAIIVKHHPFVTQRSGIPDKYRDVIIDMSDQSELNDLLFIADLLVTDYSSVIFEAALLDIPMLFYAYDLQRYIATRGFYYEFENFVPGKIVQTFQAVVRAIKEQDFELDKIESFKNRFFDDLDGKSAQRTVDLIYRCMRDN